MKLKQCRVCPTCQRPILRPINVGGKIRQAMFDFIADHDGVTAEQIMGHAYQDDPQGGPPNTNIVSSTVVAINRELRIQNRKIQVVGSGGPGSLYRIESRLLMELTQKQLDEIRKLHLVQNISQKKLAQRYNLSQGVVSMIIRKRSLERFVKIGGPT